jgi:putative ABC transport system substrate-binding protein
MNRRTVTIALATAALASRARAQAGKPVRIGFLYPGVAAAAPPRMAALQQGLRDSGYRDAGRVEIVVRASEGDMSKLGGLAAELVADKVDGIVAAAAPALRAAQAATRTIPIFALDLEADPVADHFVASIARPGSNLTGIFADFPDFGMKWIELLKEALPALKNTVILWDPSVGPVQLDAVRTAGGKLRVTQQVVEVKALAGMEQAFAAAAEKRPDAVVLLPSPLFGTNPRLLADLALAHRLPSITLYPESARAGVLMAYGPNLLGAFRQLGLVVAKVLQGANPADLPVERPTTFEMIVNLKTAKALGLALARSVLLRADEVIE